jgi:hypothetical protein
MGEVLVTTGPQDPATAGGSRLRAGHADREQVIEALKDAFAHGQLTRDELDTRAGQALSARTYADLAALTADLPPAPAPVDGPHPPVPASSVPAPVAPAPSAATPVGRARPPVLVRRRPLVRTATGVGSCLAVTVVAVWAHHVVDPGNTPTPYEAWATPMFLVAVFSVLIALGFLAYGVIASAEQRGARRQLPPPPPRSPGPDGHGDRASDRRRGAGADSAPPGRRAGQGRADLRAHKPRRHPHIPARAGRLRGVRPTPGAA